jgi:hypothetical protein
MMTNQNHALEAIVALICVVAATGIFPDSLFSQSKSPSVTKRSIGNANAAQDLYGVGIRVGFYLQALAGVIAVIRPLRSPGGGTPIIFSSAVFIAILAAWTKMAVSRDISPAETIVVINMLGSNSNAIINAIYNTGIRGSAIGLLICILMHIWEVCIMVWFWPVGQHRLPALRTGGYTWFFVKVHIDGWYKWTMTTFSAIGVIFLILLICPLGLKLLSAVNWWWKSSSQEARWVRLLLDILFRGLTSFVDNQKLPGSPKKKTRLR